MIDNQGNPIDTLLDGIKAVKRFIKLSGNG